MFRISSWEILQGEAVFEVKGILRVQVEDLVRNHDVADPGTHRRGLPHHVAPRIFLVPAAIWEKTW